MSTPRFRHFLFSLPSTTEENGDPGNNPPSPPPLDPQSVQYLRAFRRVVTEEDIKEITEMLYRKAMAGDMAAAEFLVALVIGPV
jgi:hypothetical protein